MSTPKPVVAGSNDAATFQIVLSRNYAGQQADLNRMGQSVVWLFEICYYYHSEVMGLTF